MRRRTKVFVGLTLLCGVVAFTSLYMVRDRSNDMQVDLSADFDPSFNLMDSAIGTAYAHSTGPKCMNLPSASRSGADWRILSSSVTPFPPNSFLNPTGKAVLGVSLNGRCGGDRIRYNDRITLVEFPVILEKQTSGPYQGCPDLSSLSVYDSPETLGQRFEDIFASLLGAPPGVDLDPILAGQLTAHPDCIFSTGAALISQGISLLECIVTNGYVHYSCTGGSPSEPDWSWGELSACGLAELLGDPAPTPLCGNGVTETGEDCDDGDQDNSDACPCDCITPLP